MAKGVPNKNWPEVVPKETGQARGASNKKTGGGAEQGPDGAGSPK